MILTTSTFVGLSSSTRISGNTSDPTQASQNFSDSAVLSVSPSLFPCPVYFLTRVCLRLRLEDKEFSGETESITSIFRSRRTRATVLAEGPAGMSSALIRLLRRVIALQSKVSVSEMGVQRRGLGRRGWWMKVCAGLLSVKSCPVRSDRHSFISNEHP